MLKIEKHIKSLIMTNGYMTLDAFLSIVINFYYANQDSLGESGDFITAPEISQLFGEIIGLYFANYWLENCNEHKFNIVEFGPGRGYLLADFLRGTKNIRGFHNAINKIILFESSPRLIQIQKEALFFYSNICHWISDLNDLDDHIKNYPCFFIANEFFDALPIKQLQNISGNLYERCLVLNDQDISLRPFIKLPLTSPNIPENAIIEIPTISHLYTNAIKRSLTTNGGNALIIDYGYFEKPYKSSLQALHKHNMVNPLSHIGKADVTALVDFSKLMDMIAAPNLQLTQWTQGEFLTHYGLKERGTALIEKYGAKRFKIEAAIDTLTSDSKMGKLFKILAIAA